MAVFFGGLSAQLRGEWLLPGEEIVVTAEDEVTLARHAEGRVSLGSGHGLAEQARDSQQREDESLHCSVVLAA